MEQKIATERAAFSLRCKQQMKQRETLLYVKNRVERLSADYENNRDPLFKRHYGDWKRWMIQKKLFSPPGEKKNPSIPAVLKLKRDYACLWPFNTWDVLVISILAEELDSYPLNYPVSYTRLFSAWRHGSV
ncbi:hypothetical protein [Candidatus Pantoea bituminis]|uniref:hypothetical protein n=1 Tax=Candidatus Pantoea bituminis TaxID=2831036 RepID=UPI001C06398C|nr:hypothetical protein [Pantoea bituminis]